MNKHSDNQDTSWSKEVDFGKYKGLTVQEIYRIDAPYLSWLIENSIRNFTVAENIKHIIITKARREENKRRKHRSVYIL